jgi:hypothetical protein
MCRWILLTSVTLSVPVWSAEPKDPKTLDVAADKTKAAAELIAKLDDDDILLRDRLTEQLKAMGRDALPALEAAHKVKPAKRVMDQLVVLLPAARKADFDARAALFLADKDRKYDHALPGWTELKAAAKDTKESRSLMTDILNDDECRDMFVAAFDGTEAGRKVFEKRWEKKWYAIRSVTHPSGKTGLAPADPIHWMPAALLADLVAGHEYLDHYRLGLLGGYLTETDEGKLARKEKGKFGPVVRAVGAYWIEQQTTQIGMVQCDSMATYLGFDKDVRLQLVERHFERAVVEKWPQPPFGPLAQTNDPKYIASFRRLFDSEAVFREKREDIRSEYVMVRDAALSMCIALSGQDPEEYGFAASTPVTEQNRLRFSPSNYYFAGDKKAADEKRSTAFKKWAEWEKANPDKVKAKAPDKK